MTYCRYFTKSEEVELRMCKLLFLKLNSSNIFCLQLQPTSCFKYSTMKEDLESQTLSLLFLPSSMPMLRCKFLRLLQYYKFTNSTLIREPVLLTSSLHFLLLIQTSSLSPFRLLLLTNKSKSSTTSAMLRSLIFDPRFLLFLKK